jgi:hypothetical protein
MYGLSGELTVIPDNYVVVIVRHTLAGSKQGAKKFDVKDLFSGR